MPNTVILAQLDARLQLIESDLRWAAQQDRDGDYEALDRTYRSLTDAYAERRRIRTELQQEHAALTGEYVRLASALGREAPRAA